MFCNRQRPQAASSLPAVLRCCPTAGTTPTVPRCYRPVGHVACGRSLMGDRSSSCPRANVVVRTRATLRTGGPLLSDRGACSVRAHLCSSDLWLTARSRPVDTHHHRSPAWLARRQAAAAPSLCASASASHLVYVQTTLEGRTGRRRHTTRQHLVVFGLPKKPRVGERSREYDKKAKRTGRHWL